MNGVEAPGDKALSDFALVRNYVSVALDQLNQGMVAVTAIHRFAQEVPHLFSRAAISILQQELPPASSRFLCLLLLEMPGFYGRLVRLSQHDVRRSAPVMTKMVQAERLLDIKLARHLPPRYGSGDRETLRGKLAEGGLDVLDRISDGRRLVPLIMHLAQSSDPRLSAKATLVVGRRLQSVKWSKQALENSTDPRIRANAIEALWGLESADARKLMAACLRDGNNRVVGNAALGLYLAGDESATRHLEQLAVESEARFRATAAWAMGRAADPELLAPLSRLIKDDSPIVRIAALRAVMGLRKAELRRRAVEENGPAEGIDEQLKDAAERQPPPVEEPPVEVPRPLIETVLHFDGRHHSASSRAISR